MVCGFHSQLWLLTQTPTNSASGVDWWWLTGHCQRPGLASKPLYHLWTEPGNLSALLSPSLQMVVLNNLLVNQGYLTATCSRHICSCLFLNCSIISLFLLPALSLTEEASCDREPGIGCGHLASSPALPVTRCVNLFPHLNWLLQGIVT